MTQSKIKSNVTRRHLVDRCRTRRVYFFVKMDISVLCLMFFLGMCTTATSFFVDHPNSEPTETTTAMATSTTATTTSAPIQLHVSEMGKGLDAVPPGSPYMRSVNFGYNHIRNLPPYVFFFYGYSALNKIELCQNKIANVSHKAFRQLFQLRVVDLSGNNLTSLETGTFKANTRLEKLDLSDNSIRFNPHKAFLNSASLETLILSNNRIDQIFSISFVKLPKLRNLMMNGNYIFAIEVSSFVPLKQLQTLSMADTGLDRLSGSMFLNNTYPRLIDIKNTPLANKFDPPLKIVKNHGVVSLINIDNYF